VTTLIPRRTSEIFRMHRALFRLWLTCLVVANVQTLKSPFQKWLKGSRLHELFEADQRSGQLINGEEVTFRPLVAHSQSTMVIEPARSCIDDPAYPSEATAVDLVLGHGKDLLDASRPRGTTILFPAVRAIADKKLWTESRSLSRALNRRDQIEQIDCGNAAWDVCRDGRECHRCISTVRLRSAHWNEQFDLLLQFTRNQLSCHGLFTLMALIGTLR
jgi:hypothetical protein